MDIHERLAHARRVADLTQDEVAAHFGIRRVSVAQWESARSKPSIEKIKTLAGLYNTSPEWILSGEGKAPTLVQTEGDLGGSFNPEMSRQILERLKNADPAVREAILLLLGLRG